ncbi:SCO family protein [Rhizobium dioscoreae]|uniref:SCO family protein n=1 Tax=Rhizobium TaxID=379 RepID=UPI0011993891|nr:MULTISPECIES: SCO family protein [Rhizobium]MCZ3377125.1 SCO family protein [Rhizobium sp. AG207R]TWB12705.1 protein SCO1/2 [Rhizobium sp. ERR1071]GES41872.1 SCO family protein [Rhizobium dioscoreae]
MSNRRRFVATAVALTLAAGAGVIGYATFLMVPEVQATGSHSTAFTLTDDRGEPITEKALSGHPSLVYFGYTHCPDVCPTTLYDMAGWFKTLGPQADGLKAYFFTVDPERDTPEIMHSYTGNFTDRITGITGDPTEMQKAIKGWRIYAKKVPSPDGGYTMDHTASVLLVDAGGNLRGTIAYQENNDVALQKIRNLLRQD